MEGKQEADNSWDEDKSSYDVELEDPVQDGKVLGVVVAGDVQNEENDCDGYATDGKAESSISMSWSQMMIFNGMGE